jgi:hypothetical protein
MTDEISLLQKLERYLQREAEEVEQRRMWYEEKVSRLLGLETTVLFCTPAPMWDGYQPGGSMERKPDGGFLMKLSPGLDLLVEHSLFSHETIHAAEMKFAPPSSETPLSPEAFQAFINSKELAAMFPPGVDPKKIYWTEYNKNEDETDFYARQLHQILFPGENYIPCSSRRKI